MSFDQVLCTGNELDNPVEGYRHIPLDHFVIKDLFSWNFVAQMPEILFLREGLTDHCIAKKFSLKCLFIKLRQPGFHILCHAA